MKKFLSALLVLLLLAMCLTVQVGAASLTEQSPGEAAKAMVFPTDGSTCKAICPVCCKEVNWYALNAATVSAGKTLSKNYHYYLSEDVDTSRSDGALISAASTTGSRCCLHLNGKKLINRGNTALMGSGSRFNVLGEGTVQGANTGAQNGATVQINTSSPSGAVVLYGGTYSKVNPDTTANVIAPRGNGGIIELHDGATIQAGTAGSAVYLNGEMTYVSSIFRMYGGVLDASATSELAVDMEADANKRTNKVEFHMAGGVLTAGGAGCVTVRDTTAVYMSGGIIQGGKASKGGNIYIEAYGKMVLSGGTVQGGNATNGGNIYIAPNGRLEMTGGAIKNGIATGNGGNIFVDENALFTMSGGAVSGTRDEKGNAVGGKAKNGGNIYIGYTGDAIEENPGEFIMTGGTVENGTATSEGGNIYAVGTNAAAKNSRITLKNATVIGGKATSNGGNMVLNRSTLTMEDGAEILNGISGARAGSIRLYIGKIIMKGGRIAGGSAATGNADNIWAYGVSNSYPGSVYMLGGVIEPSDDAHNTGVALAAYGRLYLANDATVADKNPANAAICVGSSSSNYGKLFICDGWSGSADVYILDHGYAAGSTVSTTYAQIVKLKDDLSTTVGGSFTGTLTQCYEGTGLFVPSTSSGKLTVASAVLVADDGKITATTDPLTNWNSSDFTYLKLSADLTVEDLGEKVLCVDLNGYNLTVGGSGTVKAFDSRNDTYNASLCGKITANGTVKVESEVVAPNGNRYIALTDNNNITMHRVDMYLTTVSLRASQAGIYYKATYKCDAAVEKKVTEYGIVLSVHNMPGADFFTAEESSDKNAYTVGKNNFKSGMTANSGAVFGIMKTERDNATNDAYGKIHVYANPYIRINSDSIHVGDTKNVGKSVTDTDFDGVACSLQDVLKKVDEIFFNYDVSARERVADFYQTWKNNGMNWKFDNISGKTSTADNSNLSFSSGTDAVCSVCQKTVTWKAVTQAAYGTIRLGALSNGDHYYLEEDITYTGADNFFLQAPASGSACLHLNGHSLVATNNGAIIGYSGTLNVMGSGIVMGNLTAENQGAAVHINTTGSNGVVNLYGGTYTLPATNTTAAAVSIWANGGKINLYEGATAKGNGSGNAIYVHEAQNADAVLGVHGANVTDGRLYMAVPEGKTSTLNISGNAYIEHLVLKSMYINVNLSGAPVVDTWAAASGNQINIESLSEGADITIATRSVFTQPNDKIAEYAKYFRPLVDTDTLVVTEDKTLRYDLNYELYMTPYIRDVSAEAVADGKIHYYFMSTEGMVVSPTAEDNIYKWGDSCLIVFPNGETMLVDTGYAMQQPWVIGNLKRMGVGGEENPLDYLLITHPHSDHQGAFYSSSTFFDEIKVEQVFHNKLVVKNADTDDYVENVCTARNIPLTNLKQGTEMDFGNVHMEVLWPEQGTENTEIGSGEINDNSMVFRLDYGEHSALFTGDVYALAEGQILESVDNSKLDVDFLKIPHHGWNTSSSEKFVNAVSPEIAVATSYLEMDEYIRQRYVKTKTKVLLDVYNGYIHVSAGSDGEMVTETSR